MTRSPVPWRWDVMRVRPGHRLGLILVCLGLVLAGCSRGGGGPDPTTTPDDRFVIRVARCESGLDPSQITPPYQASGLFQFLPGTWATTPYADQYILDPVASANAAAWMWSVGRRGEWVCQ